jgi:hypothetical protein
MGSKSKARDKQRHFLLRKFGKTFVQDRFLEMMLTVARQSPIVEPSVVDPVGSGHGFVNLQVRNEIRRRTYHLCGRLEPYWDERRIQTSKSLLLLLERKRNDKDAFLLSYARLNRSP